MMSDNLVNALTTVLNSLSAAQREDLLKQFQPPKENYVASTNNNIAANLFRNPRRDLLEGRTTLSRVMGVAQYDDAPDVYKHVDTNSHGSLYSKKF